MCDWKFFRKGAKHDTNSTIDDPLHFARSTGYGDRALADAYAASVGSTNAYDRGELSLSPVEKVAGKTRERAISCPWSFPPQPSIFLR